MKTVAILYFCFLYFSAEEELKLPVCTRHAADQSQQTRPCDQSEQSRLLERYTLPSFPNNLEIESVDDVYEYLWENNKYIATETIQLDFLEEMEKGSLSAERYIKFTMQDINYVLRVRDMLEEIIKNVHTMPDDIKNFIEDKYKGYKKFADYMLDEFSFKGEPLVSPTPAMQNYLLTYTNLMEEPLYFVVGLLPCSRLWVWLANNLETPQNSAYYNWKVDNMDGHPEKFKPLLNKYLDTLEKVAKANDIFHEQMQNEHDFFSSS